MCSERFLIRQDILEANSGEQRVIFDGIRRCFFLFLRLFIGVRDGWQTEGRLVYFSKVLRGKGLIIEEMIVHLMILLDI